ncbi:trypsin-like peptidase domain-containing protein [Streptomyces alboflavus]|uniref:trypsin-like peptidase domain-containing protein n=1 Tax=Streptomyces alboflavus TaxID=67267 RepID=UPI003B968C14
MPAPAAPAPGTPQPPAAQGHVPHAHGTQTAAMPAPGAPLDAAAGQGTSAPGAPGPGTPQPSAAQGHVPHAHGTQTAAMPAPGAPLDAAAGQGTSAPGAPGPGPYPQAASPQGPPSHATPTHGTPPPGADAFAQPNPGPEVAGAGVLGAGGGGGGGTGAVGHGAAGPGGPWQRYDPWSAPLQQTGAAVETEGQRRRRGRRVLVLGAALIALVAGGIGGVVGAQLERDGGFGGDVELPQAESGSQKRSKDSVAGIAASALPGVVTLHVRGDDGAGTGTGFVLDAKGHILTNNHVVEPGGSGGDISVTFSGGETAGAKVVGRDAGYDLAVVKVSGVRGLKPLPLGNSENVQVGDPVVAIGAPFDLANTVTSGIISAKERPITAGGEKGDGSDVSYVNALQTDAPINPGNSGGPLVDSRARVIGINSAIRSAGNDSGPDGGQSGSIGLGFAIPINQGKRVAEELINTGRATHPVIGVTIDKQFTGDGARIARESRNGGPAVNRGGPGAKAGLKAGDVITAVDGQRVHSGDELIVKVRAHRPKDRLELTVERGGDERKVTLVLGTASGE